MKVHGRNTTGVTLIELIAAIAILGIVMAGAYEILHTAGRISNRQQQAALASQIAWQSLQQISRELRAATAVGRGRPLTGQNSTLPVSAAMGGSAEDLPAPFADGRLPADILSFSTVASDPATDTPRPGVVEYALYQENDGRVTGLSRRFVGPEQPLGGAPRALHNPQTVAMDCEYMNQEGRWLTAWDSPALPVAVRITVWVQTSLPGELIEVQDFRTVVHLPSGEEASDE